MADDGAGFDADAALRAAREACLANMLKASIGAPRMLGRRPRTRALHQIVHQNTPPPKAKIPFDADDDATTSGALEMRRRIREPRVTSSRRYHASIRARIYPRGTYPPVLRPRVLCELDVLEGWGLPKQISKASFGSKKFPRCAEESRPIRRLHFVGLYLPSADSRAGLPSQKAPGKRRCEQAAAAFARRTSEGGASGTGRREV